ncbi:MAG: DEAD/DEAH box helicase family protein [Desulfobulbia bacterium]
MDKIIIGVCSEAHLFVTSTNEGIERELVEHFKFPVPNAKFMPSFKRGHWDGNIRLYNKDTKLIYRGLLPRILKFAKDSGYSIDIDKDVHQTHNLTPEDFQKFIDTLNLPFPPRDYQFAAALKAINSKRQTILSPTGSGKSLIIYLIARFLKQKTLIIVPTLTLVRQMAGDFEDYRCVDEIHQIYGGKDKKFDCKIAVTTWQSIFRMPRSFFAEFGCIIVDEVHGAKSKSLMGILEKASEIPYRYGTTGTLDGSDTHQWTIEGLLGPIHKVVTTSKLIEDEVLADFNIDCLLMRWPSKISEIVSQYTYQEEIDFLVTNETRNKMITNLVLSKPGNNLVLFNFIEKHGDVLYEMFKKATDRPIYYVVGKVDADVRDEYRSMIEKESDAIVLASIKAFATGTNIKKLDNIFFCHPSKSRIVTLQAIGRVLRRSEDKTKATLFDIVDDLSCGSAKNYSLRHYLERLKIYKSEGFPFTVKKFGYKK